MKISSIASTLLLVAPSLASASDETGYHVLHDDGSAALFAKQAKSKTGKSSKSSKSVKSAKSAKADSKAGAKAAYSKSSKAYEAKAAKVHTSTGDHGSAAAGGGGGGNDHSPITPPASSSSGPDAEAVRSLLKLYRESLESGLQSDRGYHASASKQVPDYNTCTIVQQCLDPKFILSLGLMAPRSRGHAYNALSKAMSAESFNMLQLQQHSNMLLGEMQDWGTACRGHCRELNDADGLLEPIVEAGLESQSVKIPFLNYGECGNLRQEKRQTLWYCDEAPQMIHQANIDVSTGKYSLGDIWNEPHIHGRNSWYDYFAAYGDLEEGGGPFGLRFSGHHMDVNYRWDGEGELISDLPVFLGHNPLIVPSVHPPLKRGFDEQTHEDHFYTPLLWANMAGIAQFPEAVGLVLKAANILLTVAPDALVPLSEWESVGAFGALLPSDKREAKDFPGHLDLSTTAEDDFDIIWDLVDYTLRFSRGHRSTADERAAFRAGGRVIWTSQSPPEDGLPLSEEDIRSDMNFLNLRVETDDVLFFVMTNQLFCVISESEPTNHLHSIYMPKELLNADHACLNNSSKVEGALCGSLKKKDFVDEHEEVLISTDYKYHSSKWEERLIKSDVSLDVDAFEAAVQKWSDDQCGLGVTATLFDNTGEMVYQGTVGTMYTPMTDQPYGTSTGYGELEDGWTGDTVFNPFSNTKATAAAAFIASVVDTGLGYLDEPLRITFPELPEDSPVGLVTPRMILSHTSGLGYFAREDPENDPYYTCLYDEETTADECVVTHVLAAENYADPTVTAYNNAAFDVLAVLEVRKTGMNNYGEIFQKYITEPLGMGDTTFDCPHMRSTSDKPHVAWGLCTTGNDFPKFVQMLAKDGMSPDETQVLSKYGVTQMFTHGGGNAISGDMLLGIPDSPFTIFVGNRCYPRMKMYEGVSYDLPTSPFVDYGLGTMFFAGSHGELFGHYGSAGGGWLVAPGRFALYMAWMAHPAVAPVAGLAYIYSGDVLNTLEKASNFTVTSTFGEEHWEDIPVCGGGLYDDLFEHLSIDSTKEYVDSFFPITCEDSQRRTASLAGPLSNSADYNIESFIESYNML